MQVIDRRQNPKAKSLGNRQRFVRRVKSHIRESVKDAIENRRIADLDSGEKVSISANDVSEPTFGFDKRPRKSKLRIPRKSRLPTRGPNPKALRAGRAAGRAVAPMAMAKTSLSSR